MTAPGRDPQPTKPPFGGWLPLADCPPLPAGAPAALSMSQPGGAETRADEVSPTANGTNETIIQQLQERLRSMEEEKQQIMNTIANLSNGTNADETQDRTNATAGETDVNSTESNLSENGLPVNHPTEETPDEQYGGHEDFEMIEELHDSPWSEILELRAKLHATEHTVRELSSRLSAEENKNHELKRQLEIEARTRRLVEEELRRQESLIQELKVKNAHLGATRKSEVRLRQMKVEELRKIIEEKDRATEELTQRLCDRDQRVAELETLCSRESEILVEHPLLVEQLKEFEKDFRAEHHELMKMTRDKDRFEHYNKVYEQERDRALERAVAAEMRASDLERGRRSPQYDQFENAKHGGASQLPATEPHSQHERPNLPAVVWPFSPTYNFPTYPKQLATSEASYPQGIRPNPQSPQRLGKPTANRKPDSLLGAAGGYDSSRMSQSAVENMSPEYEAEGPPWWFSSSATALKAAGGETKDGMWKCLACGLSNMPDRHTCSRCGTIDHIQSHRLS